MPTAGSTGSAAIKAAPGALIDKITSLEFEAKRIGDPEKLRNTRTEEEGPAGGPRPDDFGLYARLDHVGK